MGKNSFVTATVLFFFCTITSMVGLKSVTESAGEEGREKEKREREREREKARSGDEWTKVLFASLTVKHHRQRTKYKKEYRIQNLYCL